MSSSSVSRSFVLGLDGVPWNLLSQWANDGHLPNVSRIMNEGAQGPLQSTLPPTTAIAWPSIATGVRADKHGIYAFQNLTSSYGRTINTSRTIREPPIWELLSPSIVANVPMTYPASEIDGTMITGMMTATRESGFTHPPEFAETIEQEVPEYEIGLAWHDYHGRESAFLDDLSELVRARRKLMHLLMEREDWTLFFFVYTAPDRLQHLIWDTDVILDHYRELDEVLGDVIDYVADRDANLFVLSDHGFGPVSETMHLNAFLAREGYLQRKENAGTRGAFDRLGINKQRVSSLLSRAGLEDILIKLLPDRLLDDIASSIPGEHGMYDVDFSETYAFAYSGNLVYVNDALRFDDGVIAPAARDGVKKEVKATLEMTRHPETGEPFLDVYDGSKLFPTDPKAPDLVVVGPPGTDIHSSLSPEVFTPATERAASHRQTGIFLAMGPNIATTTITDATVYDLLPTLLHGIDRPIPRDGDGKILDIYEPDSPPATRRPRTEAYRRGSTVDSVSENFDDVEDRLRGLGYIE